MGWTPHTRQELQNAGVSFSMPETVTETTPVIIGAETPNISYNPVAAMAAAGTPIKTNTGMSAKEMSTISANVGESLGSVGAAAGLDPGGLEKLIMENTDKNNEWSAAQAQKQMDFQERMQGIAQEFNASEAAKNREWQEMMSNTAHQREVADLKAAGLNPILSASGGNGASVGSGASASLGVPNGAQGNGDQSGNSALVSIYSALLNAQTQMYNANLSAKTNLKMAELQTEAAMYGSALSAEASRYVAGTNYAASVYGSDMAFKNNEAERQWKTDHPSNAWSFGSSIFGNEGVSGALQNARDFASALFGKKKGSVSGKF